MATFVGCGIPAVIFTIGTPLAEGDRVPGNSAALAGGRGPADVVVIGAGVVGCSIALQLARAGFAVVVLDRNGAVGAGSTSASSAVVRFHYSTRAGVVAAWESKFSWECWGDFLGHDDPAGLARYIRTGGLVLESPVFAMDRVTGLFTDVGIPFEVLSAAELSERFPGLDTGRYYPPRALDDDRFWDDAAGEVGALWTPDGGYIHDPQLATHNLAHAAQQEGARLMLATTVAGIRTSRGRVTGVRTSDGTEIGATIVVNAAGPHSGRLNEMAGVQAEFAISTRPLRQEVHHIAPAPGQSLSGLTHVSDCDLGTYFRPEPGGGLLVGGQEPECDPMHWLDDPDDYNPAVTTAVFDAQVTRLARRVPDVRVPTRPTGIAGIYDVSDDWIPIYDRTSLRGYYVAIGTSGNQFKNAPVIGQLMTRLISECEAGRDHDADPVTWRAPHAHLDVDLAHYSRRRKPHSSSGTVMG
jgi:sarcosine oxidase, subunit beta